MGTYRTTWDICRDNQTVEIEAAPEEAEQAMRRAVEADMLSEGWEIDDEARQEIDEAVRSMRLVHPEIEHVLERHGPRFTGNNVSDEADGWIEHGFNTSEIDAWCDVGCWDPYTAQRLKDEGLESSDVEAACKYLCDQFDDPYEQADAYTDGDPMYALCNNDIDIHVILDAHRKVAANL